MFRKFQNWWLFHFKNPVIHRGESEAFLWVFRRFTLDIRTRSGNFSCRIFASEHPYGYLWVSVEQGNEANVQGFAERLYLAQGLLTQDQKLVNDFDRAVENFRKRLEKGIIVEEDPEEEQASLESEKKLQEYVEASPKERKRARRSAKKAE